MPVAARLRRSVSGNKQGTRVRRLRISIPKSAGILRKTKHTTERNPTMTQIDRMEFRIAKADHGKALELFTKILGYQRSHPEIYYYTLSRSWFRQAPANTGT